MQRLSIHHFQQKKTKGERFAMVTCYDATFAQLLELAGIEIVLVGDSLGNVIKGEATTTMVTMEEMIYHTQCVVRGSSKMLIVADMPFGSYQITHDQALHNGFRLIKEGGAGAIKIEGGQRYASLVRDFVEQGIPVVGHLGLTPQSVHQLGGYRVQGKKAEDAKKIKEDAHLLEAAGCFAIVLECVPEDLATEISQSLQIPVIGIGAGVHTDAQILVLQDMLGLNTHSLPKFVRNYAELGNQTVDALARYQDDVLNGHFPSKEESYH